MAGRPVGHLIAYGLKLHLLLLSLFRRVPYGMRLVAFCNILDSRLRVVDGNFAIEK